MATVKHYRFDDVKSALLSKQKYDDDVEPKSGEGLVAIGRSSDREKVKRITKKNPEKAAEVAIAKGYSDGDVYLAINTEKSRDELIVDSGCTFHVIPYWSWFTTYESFNGGMCIWEIILFVLLLGRVIFKLRYMTVLLRPLWEFDKLQI
nr:retrovirus-related Pol polyprotein from transposon TNT 1-94 [Tanacetum cinerariifolium]